MRTQSLILIFLLPMLTSAAEFTRPNRSQSSTPQARSVFHLRLKDSLSCSGVLIGSGGEALTNLHCVEKCLKEAGAVRETALSENVSRYDITLTTPVSCAVEISNGKRPVPQEIQILHIFGPGFLGPRDALPEFVERRPEQFESLLRQGYEGSGDLALIRIDTSSLQEPTCIRISDNSLLSENSRAPVYGFSYPIVTRFKESDNPIQSDVFMTLGGTLLRSQGEAINNLNLLNSELAAPARRFIEAWMGPGTFLTSLDAEGGASGSAVFDTEGKLAGIMRSIFKAPGTGFAPWMSEAVDLGPKTQIIRSLVPSNGLCQ
jgi:hypothetical protein